MIVGDMILLPKYCETILDEDLVTDLEEDQFDLAIIDLMFNGLALAHRLNLPVVDILFHIFSCLMQFLTVSDSFY